MLNTNIQNKLSSTIHRCVLVLGSYRAGTFVLSRALIVAGVYWGENLYGPRFDNPKGLFENKCAHQSNELFLKGHD